MGAAREIMSLYIWNTAGEIFTKKESYIVSRMMRDLMLFYHCFNIVLLNTVLFA